MKYYIGVDGGGTKTAFALFDENKSLLTLHEGPGSNHENLEGTFEEACAIIWQGLGDLLRKAGKSWTDIRFTLMGLAGIDHPFQYDIMSGILRRLGLENFELFNDGFIVVKAGSQSGAAIGYNCGTGTCCNAIDSEGKMLMLAGLGAASGDTGGGGWIAERSFRLIYDELYLGLHETMLTKLMMNEYKLRSREEFLGTVSWIEDEEKGPEFIRFLLRSFFAAVNAGDAPALKYMEEMAERGAQMIAALAKQMTFTGNEIEVVLSGSIHTKLDSGVYRALLEEKARAFSGKQLKFTLLQDPPVTGCVNWILQDYDK